MEKTTTPPCAACKYLRRKCIKDCVFAPYFSTDKQENYEAVHKVFGASHVAKFINDLHPSKRETAMHTLAWEARVRLNDPVNGCSAIINSLHRKLQDLEDQVAIAKKELASYGIVPTFEPPPPTAYQQIHHNPMPPPPTAYQQTHHNPMPPPPIAYQQIHHNPMMSATPNNDGFLTAQQSQDEAHRFASTQTAQMQQTQETQTQHNESVMNNVRDKKVNGPHKQG